MYTLHIQYNKCTPLGFQKPEPVGVGPKLMCTSCGSELDNKKRMQVHIDKYLNDKCEMTCQPNTVLKQNRVNWNAAVQAQPKIWLKPKSAECPVCFETKLLSPFCYNEHLVCRKCLPKLKICPLCRGGEISWRHQIEAGMLNPVSSFMRHQIEAGIVNPL